MKKQANSGQEMPQELKEMQVSLQTMFTNMSSEQRTAVANYLNAYNLAAWIYNELLNEDQRNYIDLSMRLVIETQKLDQMMQQADGSDAYVEQVNNLINGN